MYGSDKKLPGRVLAMLCAGRGWSRKELAREASLRAPYLSELIGGHAPLPEELLLRLAYLMGYRRNFVESLFQELGKAQGVEPGAPEGPEEAIDALAEGAARAFGSGIRSAIHNAHRDALAMTARAIGEELWRFYRDLPPAEKRSAPLTTPLFWRWGFVEKLCQESVTAAADDHVTARELAEMAVALAERMKGKVGWRSRVEGYAWAFVANALRVAGDLRGADVAMARAKGRWEEGVAFDPGFLDAARFLEIEGSLRREQRLFPQALACLQAAVAQARPGVRPELLVSLGKLLIEMTLQEEALEPLAEAIRLSDPNVAPRLVWAARFNLLVCLCALGRAAEGDPWLPDLRRLVPKMGNALDRLRLRWLEGQIHGALGRREEAIKALEETRDGFTARGMFFDAALAGLELCAFLLEGGRLAEVKADAPALAKVFGQLSVERELLLSLTLFCTAAQAELATAEQARTFLAQLRRKGGPGQ